MSSSCYSKIKVGDKLSLLFDSRGYVIPTDEKPYEKNSLEDREVIAIRGGEPHIEWWSVPTVAIEEYLVRGIKKATPATI